MHRTLLALVATLFLFSCGAASAQVVALGASNTRGKGVTPAQAFPAQLAAILKASGRPMTVRNAGIDGDTSSGMLARMDRAVPSGTRIVVLQVGGNDARQGIGQAQRAANIAEINRRLVARGIAVVDADGPVVGALRSGLAQADGIHLTPDGHRQVAQQLAGSIQ